MTAVAIYNLGVRDIRYNAGDDENPCYLSGDTRGKETERVAEILGSGKGCRLVSEKILENLEDKKSKLKFPMFVPALRYLEDKNIERLYLVVTDQPENVPQRVDDTVFSGEIIKKFFEDKYSFDFEVLKYETNPSKKDETYDFFGSKLNEILNIENDELYVFVSAGIPGINTALQHQAFNLLPERSHILQLKEVIEPELKEGNMSEVVEVSTEPFIRDIIVKNINILINRYDYSGAKSIAEKFRYKIQISGKVIDLLKHAERRMDFNFIEAKDALSKYDNEFENLKKSVSAPLILNRLVETYFLAKKKYELRNLSDFIWRIEAFYENGLRLMAAQIFNISFSEITYDDVERLCEINEINKENKALYSFLILNRNVKQHRNKFDNTKIFWKVVCEWYEGQTDTPGEFKASFHILNTLSDMSRLRNNMIHDLEGVSHELINNHFSAPPTEVTAKAKDGKTHEHIVPTMELFLKSVVSEDYFNKHITNHYDYINNMIKDEYE